LTLYQVLSVSDKTLISAAENDQGRAAGCAD
jgi:hypothetical protein